MTGEEGWPHAVLLSALRLWYLTSPGCTSPSESAGSGGVLAVTLFLRSFTMEM